MSRSRCCCFGLLCQFFLALLLCLSAPAWADAAFSLSGRISIRHDDEAYSGSLSWQHTAVRDDLVLTGPLGQGASELHRDANGAVLLTSDGKRHAAANMQVLADQLFGVAIPIASLPDWIRGIAPDAYLDDSGRPKRLVMHDWTVEWLHYDDAGHPVLISVESETVGVRLHIDDWHEGEDGATSAGAGVMDSPVKTAQPAQPIKPADVPNAANANVNPNAEAEQAP